MASTAARRSSSLMRSGALGGGEHPRQERDVPRGAEGVDARRGEGEVDAAIELGVAGLRLVPRVGPTGRGGGAPGHRVGQWTAVGPRPARRRLDHHDPDVALGTQSQELLRRLAVLGSRPQRRVDREHHGVEIEAAECLEVGPGHLHVVPGDPGETGVTGVAQRQDALQGGERRSSSAREVTAWAW